MQLLHRLLTREERPSRELVPSPELSSSPIRSRFEVGWATDVGKMRDHNEDTVLVIMAAQDGDHVRTPFGLLVLADGMGGHRAGEIASSMAAREAVHHIARYAYLPSLMDREHDASQPALTEILVDAIQAANDTVSNQVPGGGTTLTCALVLGTQVYIGHVGDSRAYAVTEEQLEQITHDHSVVERLVESGQLTREEATVHHQKNVLYQAVGQSSSLKVDTHVRKMLHGDHLLLCSDGLWDTVDETAIVGLVKGASSIQEACEDLVAAANEAGGPDNATAILWRCPSG